MLVLGIKINFHLVIFEQEFRSRNFSEFLLFLSVDSGVHVAAAVHGLLGFIKATWGLEGFIANLYVFLFFLVQI